VNDGVLASNEFRLVQRERGLTGATPSKCLRPWTGQQRAYECRVTVRSGWRVSELMATIEQLGSHCWTTCGPHARSPSSEEGLGAARPRWREHRKTKQSQATSRDRTRCAAIGHRSTPAHRNRYEPAQAGSFIFRTRTGGVVRSSARAGGGAAVQQLALDLGTPTRMGLASTRGRFYIQRGTKCMGPSTG
jgi:hypothetical protein